MTRWLRRLLGIEEEEDDVRSQTLNVRDVVPPTAPEAAPPAGPTQTRPVDPRPPVSWAPPPPEQDYWREKQWYSGSPAEAQPKETPREPKARAHRPPASNRPAATADAPKKETASSRTRPVARDPHFIQVGLDFGTAFLKCICRDVNRNEAWVYRNPSSDSALPFLVPATVFCDGKTVGRKGGATTPLPSPKLLLRAAARDEWSSSVVRNLPAWCAQESAGRLALLARAFAVYHLTDALALIRTDIQRQLPDFGQHGADFVAINMAIPVADAQSLRVSEVFRAALVQAWQLSEGHAAGESISLGALVAAVDRDVPTDEQAARCLVYPEVSANVQGFAKSRVSEPGVYLMSDTGAGTVDQSVFILHRQPGQSTEQLIYLAARVSMLGSGEIERRAAAQDPSLGLEALERLRIEKEQGRDIEPFRIVRIELASELDKETRSVLVSAKEKLYMPAQLQQAKVIFAGGGHTDHPYAEGVRRAFESNIFPAKVTPREIGMPRPKDLKLKSAEEHWMSRLTVAYGLSFIHEELTPFTYPVDVKDVDPKDLWQRRDRVVAPTKDDC